AVFGMGRAVRRAAVISGHASGETTILGDDEFGRMKPGVCILNAGRGALIDEAALCRALDGGIVSGAWLDTFVDEPYAGPLTAYANVVLTPHIGSATSACRSRMEREAVENLLGAFAELSPEHTRDHRARAH